VTNRIEEREINLGKKLDLMIQSAGNLKGKEREILDLEAQILEKMNVMEVIVLEE
jgi:hypothetical protein